MILENGALQEKILSSSDPVLIVKPGTWFAAQVQSSNAKDFTLISCAVSPGFDFADCILATKSELSAQFPQHGSIIERFCRQ